MIDENKNIVHIDLDRMLQIQNSLNDKSRTLDFNSDFTVPEVNSGNFSDKCDVFSFGKILLYIIETEESLISKINFEEIVNLAKMCIKIDPKEQPPISEVLLEFYINFYSLINDSNFYEVYSK